MEKRYLSQQIKSALNEKMVFISGPRQVGKTTLSKQLLNEKKDSYLNYDYPADRKLMLLSNLPIVNGVLVLDEIHKMKGWRNLIKGYHDKHFPDLKIIVTGSAKLDIYRKGGDSLQGRYRHFRLHPLSVKELDIKAKKDFLALMTLGGFPEPYFSQSEKVARIWRDGYNSRLIKEDIGSLENFKDLSQLEQLAIRLPELTGSVLSIHSLSEDLGVADLTIKRWLEAFEKTYALFRIHPFGSPLIKAVKKASKHYHYDWGQVSDLGAKFENLVACHLLKWIDYTRDTEGITYELRFHKDIEEREVDFVITDKQKPIVAIECKLKNKDASKSLIYFKRKFPNCRCIQIDVDSDKKYITNDQIEILPAIEYLKTLI